MVGCILENVHWRCQPVGLSFGFESWSGWKHPRCKYEDFSDEIEYLGYFVRPCLAVATGVGLPEVLVALVQFGRDDQITWQEQHTQKHLN